jgi:hypothetical protein
MHAQTLGARVGTSFSFFTNDIKLKGSSPALVVGGVINFPLSEKIQLTGGLDYEQIKGSLVQSPTYVTMGSASFLRLKESNITFHAAELNALIGYKLPMGFLGDAAPYLQTGASIAYTVGLWDRYTVTYVSQDARSTTNFEGLENVRSLSTTDWLPAWYVGLRFQIPLEDGLFSAMLIDFRVRNSLNRPLRPYALNGSSEELATRSISFSLGFTF